MKRLIGTLVACTLVVGLMLPGCSKKDETTEPATTQEAVAPAVDEATKAAKEAAEMAGDAAEAAKAAAEAAKLVAGTDASEAPEYMHTMVKHIKEINKLAKDNMDSCQKAAELINKYVDENKGELEASQKAAQEAMTKMTDQDKVKFGLQMQALMAPIMQETIQVQTQFSQKCAAEAKAVGEAMSKFKVK